MAKVTPEQITVRKVTHWQPSYLAVGTGKPGTYTFQFILDQGAEEAVLGVDADDADNLFDWLSSSAEVHYDTARQVLMFGTRAAGS